MLRMTISAAAVSLVLTATCAWAQNGPTLPTMPPPPSFSDPAPAAAKATKSSRKATRGKAAAGQSAPPSSSFERSDKFVPAEFDGPRGRSGGGATPMMSGSGRPGMGMKF